METIIKTAATLMLVSLMGIACPHIMAQDVHTVVGGRIDIGQNNSFSGSSANYCGVMGQSNTVSSQSGFGIGNSNNVSGPCGFGIGNSNTVSVTNGMAIGANNNVSIAGSMAFGHRNIAASSLGLAIGVRTKAGSTGNPCVVIGCGFINETASDAYLENTTPYSLAVGFNSNVPTLFVGSSPNNYGLGVKDRTGRVAIGNVTPQTKLHIRSDDDENAELFLEPGNDEDYNASVFLGDREHEITVMPDGAMRVGSDGQLNLLGSNISLQNYKMELGHYGERKLSLYSASIPSLLCNAYISNGNYYRHTPGSSYALEFGNDTLKVRTAVNQDPRGVEITNWQNALEVTTAGSVTLNGNTTINGGSNLNGGTVVNGGATLFGKVGINIANTTQDYALAVDGGVLATEVYIMTVDSWPDRVFDEDYKLLSLQDLRRFIADNRHLPDIPSEKEVREEGYDMGMMQRILLQKIEELTLYIIRQEERINDLETRLNEKTQKNEQAHDTNMP